MPACGYALQAGDLPEMVDTHPDTPDELIHRFFDESIPPLVEEKPLYGLMGASQGQAGGKPLPAFGEPPPVGTTGQGVPDQGRLFLIR